MKGGGALKRAQRPSLGRQGIGNVVDVEGLGRERHHADERIPHDTQVAAQARVLADSGFEFLGGADDGVAG